MKSVLRKLISEGRDYKAHFILALFCMFFSGMTNVLPSWIVKISIDGLSAIEEGSREFDVVPTNLQSWLPEISLETASFHYVLPLLIVSIFCVDAFFRFNYQFNVRKLGLLVVKRLREKFHWHMNRMSLATQTRYDSGSLVSRVTSDMNNLQNWVAESLINTFNESFKASFLVIWLLVIDWQLTLTVALVVPAFAIPVIKIGKKIRTYSKQGQDYIGNLTTFITESLINQRVIKAFNLQNKRQEDFIHESNDLYGTHKKWAMFMALVSPLTNVFGAFGIAAVLFLGLRSVSEGSISIGEFSSFFVTSILLYDPIKRIGRVSAILQSAIGVAERVYTVLDEDIQINETKVKVLERLNGEVEFRNVTYSYPAENHTEGKVNLFEDLNLKVDAKSALALVGPSGSGKSTLVSLLPRFYEIDKGEVLIDGIDIRSMSLKALRRQIALVTQDALLFTGTIRENIMSGNEKANSQAFMDAVKKAHVLEFAMELDKGLDSHIGERGQLLSVGQRQRVALARAFISDASIMIFDEPTSALDNESEAYIQDSIQKLKDEKTVLIIAHRLNTVKSCDRILFIQDGKIVESGTHEELTSKGGSYAKLLQEF